jgi:hypothetical protein
MHDVACHGMQGEATARRSGLNTDDTERQHALLIDQDNLPNGLAFPH